MSLHSMFATDVDMEVEGIGVVYEDTRFIVARAGGANKEFARVFNALTKPYERQISNNRLSEDVGRELLSEAYAKAVVRRVDCAKLDKAGNIARTKDKDDPRIEWIEGKYRDENGKLHDDSVGLRKSIFNKYPDLFRDIQFIAGQASNYQRQEDEDDEGNASAT